MIEGRHPKGRCAVCGTHDVQQRVPGDGSPEQISAWIVVPPDVDGWFWRSTDPKHPDEQVAVHRDVWCSECCLSFHQVTLRR